MINGFQAADIFLADLFRLALVIPTWKGFFLLPVLGYIDPNTGGMIFQILAVLFAAFSGFFLIFSGRIKAAFYKLRRRMGKSTPEVTEEGETPAENTSGNPPPSSPED